MTDQKLYDKTVKLNNGQKIPMLGFGTSLINGDDVRKSVEIALENGYRSIDTAYFYRNEVAIGEELNSWFDNGRLKREDVFVTTKLPPFGNRPEDVSKYLKKSLTALNLDYVDLYLIHLPFAFKEDPALTSNPDVYELDHETDLVQIWKAMEVQVDAGLVKSIGVSNFNIGQIDRITNIARIQPACLQIEVHVYFQQQELLEHCNKKNIRLIAFSPIRAPYTEEGKARPVLGDPTVLEIAKNIDRTACQVVLKFLIQRGICIIPKSDIPQEIEENSKLNFTLSAEDMKKLEGLHLGKEGRVYDFKTHFKGVEHHKEYPFH